MKQLPLLVPINTRETRVQYDVLRGFRNVPRSTTHRFHTHSRIAYAFSMPPFSHRTVGSLLVSGEMPRVFLLCSAQGRDTLERALCARTCTNSYEAPHDPPAGWLGLLNRKSLGLQLRIARTRPVSLCWGTVWTAGGECRAGKEGATGAEIEESFPDPRTRRQGLAGAPQERLSLGL